MSRISDRLIEIEDKIFYLRNQGCDWDEVEFELKDDGYDSIEISIAIKSVKESL